MFGCRDRLDGWGFFRCKLSTRSLTSLSSRGHDFLPVVQTVQKTVQIPREGRQHHTHQKTTLISELTYIDKVVGVPVVLPGSLFNELFCCRTAASGVVL